MKFVVVPVNPNTPVVLLYERSPPVTEREVRLILELNVFQSATERDPVVVIPARARERTLLANERPFVGDPREIVACLLLKIFQSVDERRPVAEALEFPMLIETFGQTVVLLPLVIEIAAFDEETEPKVRAACFALNIFQSATERAPVVVVLAILIPNTPVPLL